MRLVGALMAVAVLAGCGSNLPTIDDFPDETFLVYPGAEVAEKKFLPAEKTRMLHTGTTSSPATVEIRYRIPEGSSIDEVRSWYVKRWNQAGWETRPPVSGAKDPFKVALRRPEEEARASNGDRQSLATLIFEVPEWMQAEESPTEFVVNMAIPS